MHTEIENNRIQGMLPAIWSGMWHARTINAHRFMVGKPEERNHLEHVRTRG